MTILNEVLAELESAGWPEKYALSPERWAAAHEALQDWLAVDGHHIISPLSYDIPERNFLLAGCALTIQTDSTPDTGCRTHADPLVLD